MLFAGDGANSITLFAQQGSLEAATSSGTTTAADTGAEPTAATADGLLEDSSSTAPWECLCAVGQAHAADVNCVRWHPQQQGLLASAGDDGVVKLWKHDIPTAAGAAAAAAAAAEPEGVQVG